MSFIADPTFLHDRKGPWPQPNPQRPLGEAPSVLNVPWRERLDWGWHIGRRYITQLFTSIPGALLEASRKAPKAFISDERFDTLMTTSAYEKFLTAELDPEDKTDFAAYLAAKPEATFYQSVFSAIAGVDPYDGMHVAPTTCLIEDDAGTRRVAAIRVNGVVVDRSHRNAWDIAKYFVLQGAAYGMLFTEHPNLHFPFDAINAITKSSMPMEHPIFQLLHPHLRFQLQLNNAVLESPGSVITDFQPTFYAPFTADMSDGLLDLFVAGYKGVSGEKGYPTYTFRQRPKEVPGDYGVFQDAYYDTVLSFTRKVAEAIPEGEEYTRRWAAYISQWIPGFPDGDAIFEGNNLPEALAGIVWDLSIGHAVDHAAFSRDVSVEEKFLRIRIAPPESPNIAAADPSDVTTFWDRFKARVAHRVFFTPVTVTRLIDVNYNFEDPTLKAAGRQFIADLKDTDANLSVRRFIPLEEISASIQF